MAGLLQVLSNRQLDDLDAAKQAASDRQAQPLIVGLAAHLHALWSPAWMAKKPLETKMLRALRQRNGEYEADRLAEIEKQGGSGVYMMVTETKCRGAESWLRDILLEDGVIPFDVQPTPIPALPPDLMKRVHDNFASKVIDSIQQGGNAPDAEQMEEMKEMAEQETRFELLKEAQETCDAMHHKIDDQFAEGGLVAGFNEFISDLTTYPNAWLKGPVVRRQRKLDWVQDQTGKYAPSVAEVLAPTYMRVDPYRMYPEPGLTRIEDGYLFEHHRLSRPELAALIGVPGYDDDAIRAVLEEMPSGGLSNWLWSAEMQKAPMEQKHNIWQRPTQMIDALEFWGQVPGSKLIEWGMSKEDIPDPAKEYDVNAWLVGRWVIKATLNYDPLGVKPYYTTSFVKRPGALWGSSIPELIEDLQQMCNAAARALVNNMGLASGPQVEVNIDRLPSDEEITSLFPWKIWQTTNDPMGSGQPAVRFNQPTSNAQELMQVYTHFTKLADDQSGIPAYVYGDMNVGGAGRTASGLSMLMGSAGKGIRQVIMHIDMDVIGLLIKAQYSWNMRYVDDEAIKGDAQCVPKGAVTLANKDQLNVRRVEFLQATANPLDSQIVGIPGRAAILREVAKGLSMPVDDIVPSDEKLEAMQKQQEAAQQAQQNQQIQLQRDGNGQVTGAQMSPGGKPAATNPGGDKMGGGSGNQVTNMQTGRT